MPCCSLSFDTLSKTTTEFINKIIQRSVMYHENIASGESQSHEERLVIEEIQFIYKIVCTISFLRTQYDCSILFIFLMDFILFSSFFKDSTRYRKLKKNLIKRWDVLREECWDILSGLEYETEQYTKNMFIKISLEFNLIRNSWDL